MRGEGGAPWPRAKTAAPRMSKSLSRDYQRTNHECAAIILADIDKYGGSNGLAAKWARQVLSIGTAPDAAHAPISAGLYASGRTMRQGVLFGANQ